VTGSGSLHPEWDLMYRKGLSVRQIADLCGAVLGTVDRHIRLQKLRDAGLGAEHEANRPVKARPIGSLWSQNLEAVSAFHGEHGAFPTSGNDDLDTRRLARWLTLQRSRLKAGSLTPEKLRRLDDLSGWQIPQRPAIDEKRWQRRLAHLQAFKAEHRRWPRHRKAESDAERVLGVWLHGRRQEASEGRMSSEHQTTLDDTVPGWNTWKTKVHGT
jgi:hypothetical protein